MDTKIWDHSSSICKDQKKSPVSNKRMKNRKKNEVNHYYLFHNRKTMRELKFRCWDGEGMTGCTPFRHDYALSDITHECTKNDWKWRVLFEIPWIRTKHVMQSTWLHDKNGGEIYFGDIMLFNHWLEQVEYIGQIQENGWWHSCIMVPTLWEFHIENATKWQIIGNIHQSPELHQTLPDYPSCSTRYDQEAR